MRRGNLGKRQKMSHPGVTRLCSFRGKIREDSRRTHSEETAEAAPKTKAADIVAKLKKQRLTKERKAAKIALDKMESTAGLEPNTDILNELLILSGGSLSHGKTLMKKLGFSMKRQYSDDDQQEEEYDTTTGKERSFVHGVDAFELAQTQRHPDQEIETKREAARKALGTMKNTAELNNGEILKELWILSEGPPTPGKALNRLGLYIKPEYNYMLGDDDDDETLLYVDIEEGEIV